ncbi:MAG: hypothetical protein FOGNACKC_00909 [Anaerolineae bacterium]|nr:hypothetical protein [Anaerolineae bacterium]
MAADTTVKLDPVQELYAQARSKVTEAKSLLANSGDPEQARELMDAAKALKAKAEVMKEAMDFLKASDEPIQDIDFPDDDPLFDDVDGKADPENDVIKAVNVIRFSGLEGIDDPTGVVMQEIYDGDFREHIFNQTKAFGKYLRGKNPERILTRQLWTPADVKSMLMSGLGVTEIKATMVEGQDILGGYAVPPQITNDINKRIRGLTAVRQAGARVIRTASNSIQWLRIEGGDKRYPGNLRGEWGGETANPAEKNLKFGLDRINVDLYTYRLRMSASLVEDAENIIDLFNEEVADTLAIDEDAVFITGTGTNQPRGLLPGGVNKHSFAEVPSGSAAALTVTGVKKLRRGVASQYRNANAASWLANSETASTIENFQDAENRFYFEYLDNGDRFMRSAFRESEAMPDIAAGNYPLLYGDFSGYAIVERLGLAIRRYNDSYTGINMIEFQVRRRVGGDVWQPWKFAVQKVAAS